MIPDLFEIVLNYLGMTTKTYLINLEIKQLQDRVSQYMSKINNLETLRREHDPYKFNNIVYHDIYV